MSKLDELKKKEEELLIREKELELRKKELELEEQEESLDEISDKTKLGSVKKFVSRLNLSQKILLWFGILCAMFFFTASLNPQVFDQLPILVFLFVVWVFIGVKIFKSKKNSIPSLFAKKYIYYYYAFFWIILLLFVFTR